MRNLLLTTRQNDPRGGTRHWWRAAVVTVTTALLVGGFIANASPAPAVTPTPTPTTTTTTTSTDATDLSPVVANEVGAPGQSIVTIGGAVEAVTVKPNDSREALLVDGTGWAMTLAATGLGGGAALVSRDDALFIIRGRSFTAAGTGLLPNSEVAIYLMSDPALLGVFPTDANGSFSANLMAPVGITAGAHTLQVNGQTPGREVLSVSLGVRVATIGSASSEQQAAPTKALRTKVLFGVDSAYLQPAMKAALRHLIARLPAGAKVSSVKVQVVRAMQATKQGQSRAKARGAAIAAQLVTISRQRGVSIPRPIVTISKAPVSKRIVPVVIRYTT